MSSHTEKPVDRAARVLIVDDHPLVREGLRIQIARQPDMEICGEAGDVIQSLSLIDSTAPDLAIIDIALGEDDGLDLIRRIQSRNPGVRILVLSMYPETLYAERSLRAGAMGYINKQEAPGRIVEAVRTVLNGHLYLSAAMADRLVGHALGKQADVPLSNADTLSDRELEVFRLIGSGLTTAEIGERLHLSIHTIETYRQRIKSKLSLKTSAELARAAAQWSFEHG
jgi:DNA-binding NarL/FixJ family response regulator